MFPVKLNCSVWVQVLFAEVKELHLMNFKELSGQELNDLVDEGIETKRNPENYEKALEQKSLALVFQKTSTRTRVSFEVAMTQLGGHALFIDWRTTNFAMADIGDEVQYLSRNVDGIMARLLHNADLRKMMMSSQVPVINGCDEMYHPSQCIADLITDEREAWETEGGKAGLHRYP